ncbi:hypothetical protein CTI12_AA103230 [Artemisia annua]|uniref:RNA-directed DNA polymerase, eukaryota, Reverse transcriptase zinc-binding domain protein n=1 Tax=Artemisia annua TaxID=35608 RepID=A0A2U1PWT5_ARTAN|nr:hypothetical protein CTI12_AA103230 [Artemisia annua]
MSINIRGLGSDDKKGWIKSIRHKECPDLIALQETKCSTIDEFVIEVMWGCRNFGYVQKEATGNSGGLLMVWDSNVFSCKQAVGDDRFIAVKDY